MRRVLAVLVAVLGLTLATACEQSMTITDGAVKPACGNNAVEGKVSPVGATPKVVLQRTVNGKWVDWQWYTGSDDAERPHAISARPNMDDGGYFISYADRKPNGQLLTGTIHLRVRSNGGGAVSKGFYVKYPKVCR